MSEVLVLVDHVEGAPKKVSYELLTLAREVRDGVESRFGVRLVNEPVTVGCAL